MKHFVSKLDRKLNAQLQKIDIEENNAIKRSIQSIRLVEDALDELKKFTLDYEFTSQAEEINFFKELKPLIFSKLIYFSKVFNLESHKPTATRELQEAYFRQEMDKISVFYKHNFEFYQYIRMELTHLDEIYFQRGRDNLYYYRSTIMYLTDKNFTTSHDYLLSKILAYERLYQYISKELDSLLIVKSIPHGVQLGYESQIKWTDSKAALVELIYALNASGALNNGKCEIRELTSFFEHSFNIRLSDVYHTYSELKSRSTQAKFIENMKHSLLKKMEEDL